MTFKYFHSCATTEDARSLYRTLCKQHHPDLHRDNPNATVEMQEINAEYDLFCKTFRPDEMRQRAKDKGWNEPTQDDFDRYAAYDKAVREAIERIITIPGIEIEVCGLWVWVSGETKQVRKQLSAARFHWASAKGMWYFAGKPASPFARGEWTIESIRDTYGSLKIRQRKGEPKHEPRDGELTAV